MNNIINFDKSRTVTREIEAHRITPELFPESLRDRLIDTAIHIGMLYGNGEFEFKSLEGDGADEAFDELGKAVNEACRYTVQTTIEVEEPIK